MSKRRRCYFDYQEDPIIAERRRINAARERRQRETINRRAVLVRDLMFLYRVVGRQLSPAARATFLEVANHLEYYR